MAALSTAWWEADERDGDDARQALVAAHEKADEQASVRKELDTFFASLYYDRSYAGFTDGSTMDLLVANIQDKLNENVIQRIVGAMSAKLARQKPKPVMLTDGADWCLQRKAKKLEKWVWGCLQENRIYEEKRASDLQMLLKGTGLIYTGSRNGELYCEVVPPSEIKVNVASARYGKPREIYREQAIDRRQLMKLFSDHKDDIEGSAAISQDDAFNVSGSYDSDMVRVITGWRLPSYVGAGDGGMIMATDRCVLNACEWKRMKFPFAVSRFMIAPEGWFGIGMVQALVGLQLELNRLNIDRQEAVHLLSAPYVLAEEDSILATHFDNTIGKILYVKRGTAMPPQVVTPNAISPVMFEHGDRVKSGMFQQSGLSEMATQGFKPAGIDSGKAIRAYQEMVDDSIYDVLLRGEQQILDVAENLIAEAEELEAGGSKRVTYRGPRGLEHFEFDEVRMAQGSYVLTMKAASDLSTNLAGKLEDLADLRDLGIVTDPAEMQELIQMPDLETAAGRRNSMRDLILQTLEDEILEDGNAVTPEPTWDLKLAMKLCMATRWRAQLMKNVPEDRITLLRRFEKNCAYYILEAQGKKPTDAAAYEMPQQTAEQPPLDMAVEDPAMVPTTLPTDVQPGVAPAPEAMPIPGAIG